MTEKTDTDTTDKDAPVKKANEQTPPKRDRVYQVSANRGRSRHKVRYIEASAPEEGACKLCVGVMVSDSAPAPAPEPEPVQNNGKNNKNNKDNECSD